MIKILILMNVFFNYDYIERTLKSINNQILSDQIIDIIFLENPSKYSFKIKELSYKYNIKYHFLSNKNLSGQIFTYFINNYKDIIKDYDYICLTESDVILDNGCIQELTDIIVSKKNNICYTALYTNLKKYTKIQNLINTWVPKTNFKNEYAIGHTGIQFIMFKKEYLLFFFKEINSKKICNPIALGSSNYYGFSDSNLKYFNNLNNVVCYQTKNNKLEHIGWEVSIGLNKEYEEIKKYNLKNKIIRHNSELKNIVLHKININNN